MFGPGPDVPCTISLVGGTLDSNCPIVTPDSSRRLQEAQEECDAQVASSVEAKDKQFEAKINSIEAKYDAKIKEYEAEIASLKAALKSK